MKGKLFKKALAVATSVLMLSGGVPIQPLSQLFDRMAITASAAKQTVEKTVMFKMDGGDSGETTLLDDNTLYTTAGGANNTLHWTCNDPNPNNSTNIYFQNTTTPSGKHRFKTGFHGNVLSSDPSIEFLDIEGTVTKVEMVNFNLYGEVVKVSAGKNRSDTSTLLHLKDTDNEYDFRSVGGQESLNTYSTAIFVGNVNVDKDNPLKIFFTGTVKDDVSFCEFSFKNDGSGYISVTYETEEEVTGDPGHSFSYTTSGDTLTATCNQTDSNHNCGLTDHKDTLKLSADDVPYNGLIHTASVNKQEFVNATGITDITTTFSYKNKATNEVRTNGVYEIGDYTVTATITISGTAYTLTKDFSISENTHSITNNCSGLYLNRTTARPFDEVHITRAPGVNLNSLSVVGATTNLTLDNHGIQFSQNGYYWFQMPDEDVTVNAEQTDYSISVSDSIEHGSVAANVGESENAATAHYGDSVTLIVTPDTGYAIKSVKVGNEVITPVIGVYSFKMPPGDVTVTAEFEAIDYTISIAESTNGSVSATVGETANAVTAHYGDTVTLTVTPDAGYAVKIVVVDADEITPDEIPAVEITPVDGVYSFTMPASDVTVTAVFEEGITYTLVPAVEPTYLAAGNTAYYTGSDGKFYKSEDGTTFTEIEENSWIIPRLTAYMQIDTNSSNGVDVNIGAPLPEGENINEYSIKFGDTVQPFSDCDTIDIGGTTYYLVKVTCPAKNMADEYAYAVLKNGAAQEGASGTVSVRDYADNVIGGNYTSPVKKVCRAMLAYGTAAQTFFDYKTTDPANKNNREGDGTDYSAVTVPNAEFAKASLNTALATANAPVEYAGMSLTLKHDTYISIAFKVKDGTQDEAVTYVNDNFTLGGKPVSAEKNGTQFVVIRADAVSINNLMNSITLTFDNTDYTVNAGQYMYWAVTSSGDGNLANVCKALYNYYSCVTSN
ncbi:MAG: hypothetical protein IJ149_04400 [Oscillospiraceae bacterium]|nr:hypothetical protein [Oscillospiraceae bacterium]